MSTREWMNPRFTNGPLPFSVLIKGKWTRSNRIEKWDSVESQERQHACLHGNRWLSRGKARKSGSSNRLIWFSTRERGQFKIHRGVRAPRAGVGCGRSGRTKEIHELPRDGDSRSSAHCRLSRLRSTTVVPRADLIDRFTGSGKRIFMQITIRDRAALARSSTKPRKLNSRRVTIARMLMKCISFVSLFFLSSFSFAFRWPVNLFPRFFPLSSFFVLFRFLLSRF